MTQILKVREFWPMGLWWVQVFNYNENVTLIYKPLPIKTPNQSIHAHFKLWDACWIFLNCKLQFMLINFPIKMEMCVWAQLAEGDKMWGVLGSGQRMYVEGRVTPSIYESGPQQPGLDPCAASLSGFETPWSSLSGVSFVHVSYTEQLFSFWCIHTYFCRFCTLPLSPILKHF